MPTYRPERDVQPHFLDRVRGWLQASGEVFILLRHLYGYREYAFCHSFDDFAALVAAAPAGTDIQVFRDRQLPCRGRVTDEFIASVLAIFPEGVDCLVVTLDTRPGTCIAVKAGGGDRHADIRESLIDLTGRDVAVGPYPEFWVDDHDAMISAAKGGIDGAR